MCHDSHPLDTIKTRMQLRQASGSKYGLFMTGYRIVQKESFLALYKVRFQPFTRMDLSHGVACPAEGHR